MQPHPCPPTTLVSVPSGCTISIVHWVSAFRPYMTLSGKSWFDQTHLDKALGRHSGSSGAVALPLLDWPTTQLCCLSNLQAIILAYTNAAALASTAVPCGNGVLESPGAGTVDVIVHTIYNLSSGGFAFSSYKNSVHCRCQCSYSWIRQGNVIPGFVFQVWVSTTTRENQECYLSGLAEFSDGEYGKLPSVADIMVMRKPVPNHRREKVCWSKGTYQTYQWPPLL